MLRRVVRRLSVHGFSGVAADRVGAFRDSPAPWSDDAVSFLLSESVKAFGAISAGMSSLPEATSQSRSAAEVIVATAYDRTFDDLHAAASSHFALSLQFASITPVSNSSTKELQYSQLIEQLRTAMRSHRCGGWTWIVFNHVSQRAEVLNSGKCPLVLGLYPISCFYCGPGTILPHVLSDSAQSPLPSWSRRSRVGVDIGDAKVAASSFRERQDAFVERVLKHVDWDFVEKQAKEAAQWSASPERHARRSSREQSLKDRVKKAAPSAVDIEEGKDDEPSVSSAPLRHVDGDIESLTYSDGRVERFKKGVKECEMFPNGDVVWFAPADDPTGLITTTTTANKTTVWKFRDYVMTQFPPGSEFKLKTVFSDGSVSTEGW